MSGGGIQTVDGALKALSGGEEITCFLLTGDELLVRRASDAITEKLLHGAKRNIGFNCVVLDAPSASDVSEELLTVPMFRGPKVVVVREPEFLMPRRGREIDLSKIKMAWDTGKKRVAANRLLGILAKGGMGVPELLDPDADALADIGLTLADADFDFLNAVGEFCQAEGLRAAEGGTSALEALIKKGFPKGHALIVEAEKPDGTNALVKLLKKTGVFIEQKVESTLRKLDIHALSAEILKPFGKVMDADAEQLLKDCCGGSTRLIQSELEKLAVYAGDERRIRAEDVRLLVRKVREEEYSELSDAIGRRSFREALSYVEASLSRGEEPLKIHGAVASQIRMLLLARARWSRFGIQPRISQREFEAKCLPILQQECSERGTKMPHPYVAWLSFQACMRYEMGELVRALSAVADADVSLKSGRQPRLALTQMLVRIFGRQ